MPRYFIEILFYNINLKSIRDATQKFIQSLDSRKAFIPRKDENSDESTVKINQWYDELEKKLNSLGDISID